MTGAVHQNWVGAELILIGISDCKMQERITQDHSYMYVAAKGFLCNVSNY